MSCRCSPGIARQRAVACSAQPCRPIGTEACSSSRTYASRFGRKILTEARNLLIRPPGCCMAAVNQPRPASPFRRERSSATALETRSECRQRRGALGNGVEGVVRAVGSMVRGAPSAAPAFLHAGIAG